MDRSDWLKEKRRSAEARYDALFAPTYDEQWGTTPSPTHERFFGRFLGLCRPQGLVLDAACGTGKYSVFGIDQSQGMLSRAQAKFPEVPIEKVGLQEMDYREAFDGASCMDAMEFVFPEDWPPVLENFYRALKPGGCLYFTVEIADEATIEHDFAAGRQLGLPVVYGESAHEGGYHYYPQMEQVRGWLRRARFDLVEEAAGDEYHHFLVQKR